MPKINAFSWLLIHQKLIKYENLTKRGIEGIVRCTLYKKEEESIVHMFIECTFIGDVQEGFPKNRDASFILQNWVEGFLKGWVQRYSMNFLNKIYMLNLWCVDPKYINRKK